MGTLVRVTDGSLADDELAALTAVLVARTVSRAESSPAPCAHWRRPAPYRSPLSWQ